MPVRTLKVLKVWRRDGRFNVEAMEPDGRFVHELHTFDAWRASLCDRANGRTVKFETLDTRYGERIVGCQLLDAEVA